ncbi:Glucose-induced degradation protein 8-like protein [Smittium culicis]|uniref:Glucose-induced degradation protein 8-like protein n=1 Tax=Smittium culicis TaxID=133412 RepID=A0A1R1XF58_9FUNG|nr:Glucose-induced degradation protein 8-like protein [Smittium culicis]
MPEVTKTKISKQSWEAKLKETDVTKDDINKLIMEYLVIEGYKDAAEQFIDETGVNTPINLDYINERMQIKYLVLDGQISAAIEQINEINPLLLETDHVLFFKLKQQQLIELIRSGKIDEALEFSQEELALKGIENPELLPELENTMSLFAFDLAGCGSGDPAATSNLPDEIAALIDYKHRQAVASDLNSALLSSQSQPSESRLPSLLHLLVWAQDKLDEKAEFPKITNIFSGELG